MEPLAVAGLAKAGSQRVAVHVRPIRGEEHRQPAVGDLGRLLDALRPDGRDVNRDLAAVKDALERLAEPARTRAAIGDLVVRAGVLERLLARPDGAKDLDVLARAAQRVPVRHAVPSLDHLRARHPETEEHPTAGELVERGRGHGGHRRRPGRHLHDAAADVDARRLRRHPGERRDGVGPVRLRRPHGVKAEPIRFPDELHVERHLRARVADVEPESHASTSSGFS